MKLTYNTVAREICKREKSESREVNISDVKRVMRHLFDILGDVSYDWIQEAQGYFDPPLRTVSIGMEALVKQKKAWPRNGMQFCTEELKIKPAKQLMNQLDPNKEAICLVGVRREESQARRAWPEWTEESDKHDGRSLWAPLVNLTAEARDNLVIRAGFEVLPTRSQECCPCVNANREDQRQVPEVVISIEAELGISSTGKPKTMFRPKSKMGAVGIVEVIRWAKAERGKYLPIAEEPDAGNGSGCDSGFCGG